MSKKWFWWVLAVLLLVACKKDQPQVKAASLEPAVVQEPEFDLDQLKAAQATLNARPRFTGKLIFVQGSNLMLLRPGDAQPRLVAAGIDPQMVFQSPNGQHILFTRADGRNRVVYLANLQSLRHIELLTLTADQWQPQAWSPDGEWVTLVTTGHGIDLVSLDGSSTYEQIGSTSAAIYWLSNGSVLIVDGQFQLVNGLRMIIFESVEILNLQTSEITPIEIDLDLLNVDWRILNMTLANMGVAVVSSPLDFFSLRYNLYTPETSSRTCRTWHVTTLGQIPVVSLHEVYRLSNLSELHDGSWLFLRWVLPDCELDTPQVSLMQMTIDTEGNHHIDSLIDSVFGGIGFSQFSATSQQALYAATPNGIVWVGGNLESSETSLNLFHLETQTSEVLYRELIDQRGLTPPYPFISGVFWMN